ncbi:MAG: hypothetical protein CSA34_07400 [Desulfobulbus propionicus]|nr:MAG: hypothetical protein CSA34_07400 [Desulfobulbus propionicus]
MITEKNMHSSGYGRQVRQKLAGLLLWPLLCLVMVLAPVTESTALSIGEERKIGEKLLFSVRAEFDLVDAPDITAYINDLGAQVLGVVGVTNFDYHFYVVKSDQFNAFAAPAGLVFFYTGLIEQMRNEDELVGVLAHEIGHVVSRHIAGRIDKSGKINAITTALGIAGIALGVPALSQGLLAGSLAAGATINLQYSRADEEQADRLSYEWMRAMGRNPEALTGMLGTMRRITRYSLSELPQYLLTHPQPEVRLDYIESLLDLDQANPQQFAPTDNFAFLRFKYRIMAVSRDPAQLRELCVLNLSRGASKEQEVMAHYGLALLDAQERNYAGAMVHFDKVEQAYPDRRILLVDRAVLLRNIGKNKEALQLLREAVYRDPTSMYAAFELGRTLIFQGNMEEAEPYLLEVATNQPDFSQAYFELGRITARLGRAGESRFYLAKYYLYTGKIQQAKKALQQVVAEANLPGKRQTEAEDLLQKIEEIEKKT